MNSFRFKFVEMHDFCAEQQLPTRNDYSFTSILDELDEM